MTGATRQASSRVLRGYYASAAAMDGGFFLIMTAMPFKVLALGGGAWELGLVPAIGAIAYVVCAPLAGHWSDRVGRARLCLGSGLTLIAGAVLAYRAETLPTLLGLQLLMGLGKAMYWPVVQSTLGDLTAPADRVKVLGRFNVAWSGGKTLGFLLGGLLLARYGFKTVFATGAASVALAFLALPRGRQAPVDVAAPGSSGMPLAAADSAQLRALRHQAWIANLAAYGVLGILTHHLPQWFASLGWGEARYGAFLSSIFVAQTLVFLLLTGPLRFPHAPSRLWLPQIAALAVVAAVPVVTAFPLLLAVVPVLGLSCGLAYAASLHFSLESAAARGRFAGIHEAVIGAGGFLPPMLAGLAARSTGWLGAPYELAAGLLAGAIVAQILVWERYRRARGARRD
jgi:predicted MFS family arabinose efflux permease